MDAAGEEAFIEALIEQAVREATEMAGLLGLPAPDPDEPEDTDDTEARVQAPAPPPDRHHPRR